MTEPSGRWRLGLALSLATTILWGTLPVVLKMLLAGMDAPTITWYRFSIATLGLGLYLILKRSFPTPRGSFWLLGLAAAALCANHLIFLFGLDRISAETAQVVIQLAPMFLVLGSVVLFRESFRRPQWIGFLVLILGMVLFFNQRLDEFVSQWSGHTEGVLLIVVAAFLWAAYALAQKRLLGTYTSGQVLVLIYATGVLLFLPISEPGRVLELDSTQLGLLAFCAVNTIFSYGCFAEALAHWEASRVSAVIATTPLFTFGFAQVAAALWPEVTEAGSWNALSLAGAGAVAAGSVLVALGGRNARSVADRAPRNPDPDETSDLR